MGNPVRGNTRENLDEKGWSRSSQLKTCISEKGEIGPRLLLMTNRKLHTRSVTLHDLERSYRTLFQNTCVLGAHHENFNDDRPILSAAQ